MMMRIINCTLIGLLLVITTGIRAQDSVEFIMPFYFEDAIGNKDTLWYGYDARANGKDLMEELGERLVEGPLDSILDVRAFHTDDSYNEYPTKRIIARGVGPNCIITARINIYLWAKYLPVTIRYESALFRDDPCRGDAILFPDMNVQLIQYWWDDTDFYCLSHKDSIVDDFAYVLQVPVPKHTSYFHDSFPIQGGGKVLVPGYGLIIRPGSVCDALPVDRFGLTEGVNVFPNPALNWIRVEANRPYDRLQIHDINGREIYKTENVTGQLDVSGLQPGVYIARLLEGTWLVGLGKFVKL